MGKLAVLLAASMLLNCAFIYTKPSLAIAAGFAYAIALGMQ